MPALGGSEQQSLNLRLQSGDNADQLADRLGDLPFVHGRPCDSRPFRSQARSNIHLLLVQLGDGENE
jgi:hypothetical protein